MTARGHSSKQGKAYFTGYLDILQILFYKVKQPVFHCIAGNYVYR
jgi:hypothetical protein